MTLLSAGNIALSATPAATAQVASPQTTAVPTAATPPISVAGRHFVAPDGRVVLLRGVNLSGDAKVPPFHPRVTNEHFAQLQHFGFNVIRLLFIWEAYEPAPGLYDDSYTAALRSVIDTAWQHGMYVIVDFHQDGYSRFASHGAGDGFPSWAISLRSPSDVPNNGPDRWHWPLLVATDATMHRSFADFYADANGVRSRFLTAVGRVAATFASAPGVIGYDLLNEPWGEERSELAPLYRDESAVIHAQHPGALVFIEGHVTTNLGLQSRLPRPEAGNVVYAPHYYKPTNVLLNRWQGGTTSTQRAFTHMVDKASHWGVPLFIGEFGVHATVRNGGEYVADIYDRLDACLASGAQWNYTPAWNDYVKDGWNGEDYNILTPQGKPRSNFRVRPYPRLTAGVPQQFRYADQTSHMPRSLVFVWDHDATLGETEVFLPLELFPGGSVIDILPADATVVRDHVRQVVSCRSTRTEPLTLRIIAPISVD